MTKVVAYLLIGVQYALEALSWIIILNALLSLIIPPNSDIRDKLARMLNPILWPFRILSERLFARSSLPLDLSPIFACIAIRIVISILDYVVDIAMRVPL